MIEITTVAALVELYVECLNFLYKQSYLLVKKHLKWVREWGEGFEKWSL